MPRPPSSTSDVFLYFIAMQVFAYYQGSLLNDPTERAESSLLSRSSRVSYDFTDTCLPALEWLIYHFPEERGCGVGP